MKYVTTTDARKHIARLVEEVSLRNTVVAIGRRRHPDVLVVKFPQEYNPALSAELNFHANQKVFDFLKDEPDIYTIADMKKRYA